mmetsp:Transcript_16199/g.24698  ORF Transcript_16199/g.24698 Transcript_16199/m.24698 type:complete len:80 (+) Transcript_16199:419-658(+)
MSVVSLIKPNMLFRIPVSVQSQALSSVLLRFKIEKYITHEDKRKLLIFYYSLMFNIFVMSNRLKFHNLPSRPSIHIAMI